MRENVVVIKMGHRFDIHNQYVINYKNVKVQFDEKKLISNKCHKLINDISVWSFF